MPILIQGLEKVAAQYEPDIGNPCWIPMRRHLIGKAGNTFAGGNVPRCSSDIQPRGFYISCTVDGKTYKRFLHVGIKSAANAMVIGTTNVTIDGQTWKVVAYHGEEIRGGALPRS